MLAWRLCGPLAINLAALVLAVGVIALVGVENVPRLPSGALLVMSLFAFLPLTGVVSPYLAAVLLTEQHAVRPRRTATFLRVFGGAVAANAALVAIGMFILGAMGAWQARPTARARGRGRRRSAPWMCSGGGTPGRR